MTLPETDAVAGAPTTIGIDAVRAAARRIAPHVLRTPTVTTMLPVGGDELAVWTKAELLQVGGSFKLRGVLNKLLQMDAEQAERGVISMSAGNHAIALALGARLVAVAAVVVMPADASTAKVEEARRLGAEVVLTTDSLVDVLERERDRRGLTLVHPFDDLDVVTGAATVGLELCEDAPSLDTVYVPIGGGGLISGVASAVKALSPSTRVVGVEPISANAMYLAVHTGARPDTQQTIADGLKAPYAGSIPLKIVAESVDDLILVSEDQIRSAMRTVYSRARLAAEPSGAVALAGAVSQGFASGRTGIVVSGGNVAPALLAEVLIAKDD